MLPLEMSDLLTVMSGMGFLIVTLLVCRIVIHRRSQREATETRRISTQVEVSTLLL